MRWNISLDDNISKIEIEILEAIFKKEHEMELDLKLNCSLFTLAGGALPSQEVGFYLERLRRLNYLDFKDKSLTRAGQRDNRYKSDVINIWWDDIHITYKGKRFVEDNRLTRIDKIRMSFMSFWKDVIAEIRAKAISHLVTFLTGIFASYIYYLIFLR